MSLEDFYNRCNSRRNARLIIAFFFILSSITYFTWRLGVLNDQAMVFSVIFFLAEFFGLVISLFTLFITWHVKVREPAVLPPDLTVDVLIPTYNESAEIVRLTALAAKKIRYPHNTWILDDGNRSEIKKLANELGCKYLAREENTHAKAGNLNNALKYSTADFIAILDADHVPEENFLDRLLGYFNDPEVAYVQSPQDFYNIDSYQFQNNPKRKLLWHDQTFFYQIGQTGRDYWNATSFCGTSSILRRSALDRIGGFATETVTEDMHTAIRLQKAGYKSVYHPESLVYGIAATTYVEFLQQRLRWGHGNVQTLREERLPFCEGLTIPQRICYTALGLTYFEGWTRLILYFTPAIVLLTGIAPIGDTRLFFWFFIPYFLFSYLCIEEFGRGNARFFVSEFMAMARLPVYILATLGLFLKRRRWRITSKERTGAIPVYLILPQLLIFIFNLSALVVGIISPPEILILSMSGGTITVICLWALVNLILSLSFIYSVIPDRQSCEEYLFHIPVQIDISSERRSSRAATIDAISSNRIIFTAIFEQAPQIGEIIHCDIYLNELRASSNIIIDSVKPGECNSEYIVSCRLDWADINNRDLFNLKLHACGWHRQIIWSGGFFRTPLEWLSIIINPFKWKLELSNKRG